MESSVSKKYTGYTTHDLFYRGDKWGEDTSQQGMNIQKENLFGRWVGDSLLEIFPLCGSILQDGAEFGKNVN